MSAVETLPDHQTQPTEAMPAIHPPLLDTLGNITVAPRLPFEVAEDEYYLRSTHSVRKTSLAYPNILPQMRSRVTEDQIANLKNSFEQSGLANEPYYALLTPAGTQQYLDVINARWGTSVQLNDMTPLPSGDYLIVVAGHCRTISALEHAQEKGFADRKFIDAKIMLHPDPHDILMMQLAENTFEAPDPDRYAEIIQEIYLTGSIVGKYTSIADFIRKSPLKEDRIRTALKFMELPESIRHAVREGKDKGGLKYGHAVALQRYMTPYKMYLESYPHLLPEGINSDEAVSLRIQALAAQTVMERWRKPKLEAHIKGLIRGIQEELNDNAAEALFILSAIQTAKDMERAHIAIINGTLKRASANIDAAGAGLLTLPDHLKRNPDVDAGKVSASLRKLALRATAAADQIDGGIVNRDLSVD